MFLPKQNQDSFGGKKRRIISIQASESPKQQILLVYFVVLR